ncbi:MAG: DUF433 domain-containing protein [Candidatus Eisenbacteria bacterium]|nr:DUF433 domain-containing protein [Candidatus Eisenbacteria bacterium]
MGGLPCIRGLRITVAAVVDMVAEGMTVDTTIVALAKRLVNEKLAV